MFSERAGDENASMLERLEMALALRELSVLIEMLSARNCN